MQCCRSLNYPAAERQFGPRAAERDIRKYERKGPGRATRLLLDALREYRLRAESLLDIGGGVGVVSFELLSAGTTLTRATLVEASPSYLDMAAREAEKRGWSDRLRLVAGDFSNIAKSVEPADVVTMHRVICCYPEASDADALVDAMDGRNVWMIERGRHARLALETRQRFRVARECSRQNLDRDIAAKLGIVGAINIARSVLPKSAARDRRRSGGR
jgi:methyltransferase family protein